MTVAVIGAGAAGLLAAATAAGSGANVTLYERNAAAGRKLGITGKGRCNVTCDCEPAEFLRGVVRNPRFLYSAAFAFTPADTMALLESLGVPLKTERGRRVFPVSDKASDVVHALTRHALDRGARLVANERVSGLAIDEADGVRAVRGLYVSGDTRRRDYDAVIVATGGASYPGTGSDGDGYRFAREAGHTVTRLYPSLVGLETEEDVDSLEGLSLKNVSLTLRKRGGRTLYREQGEMLFTRTGVSGPLVLSASAHIEDGAPETCELSLDLKPALEQAELDKRLLSDFNKYKNRDYINALGDLLPVRLIPFVAAASGISEREKVNSITREQRRALLATLKSLVLRVRAYRPVAEAIVTRGGVAVSEVDPATMMSKLVRGLYFAGEVLDLDAYTGGYNLQIAFCTGVRAGETRGMA